MNAPEKRLLERKRGAHVFTIGFRPFFMLASLLAAVWLPIWLVAHGGELSLSSHLGPFGWHGHEMVFGFAAAVVAGFVLTAVRNWTRRPTPRGWALAALVLLWCLPRAMMPWSGQLPPALVVGADAAFLPLVAWAIALPICRARNWRNLAFPIVLLLMGAANVLSHLRPLGVVAFGFDPTVAAIDMILVLIALVGGRIVPAFTRGAIRPTPVRANNHLDTFGFYGIVAVALMHLTQPAGALGGWLALVACAANLARMRGWRTRRTLDNPLLWVLHLCWLWLCLALLASGLADLVDSVPRSVALHVATVGAIGHFTLAMMARVALGHTGRPLRAPRVMTAAFALMSAAAVLRALGPLSDAGVITLHLAGTCFASAFFIFFVRYLPILLGPRADGRSD